MLQRIWSHATHNKVPLIAMLLGALVAGKQLLGCASLFKVPDLAPATAAANPEKSALSQTPAFHASVTGAAAAQTAGQVADAVGVLPTPAAPVASAIGNFSAAYSDDIIVRLRALEQKKDATPNDLLMAQLGAFVAGLSGILIRRAPAAAAPIVSPRPTPSG